MNRHRILLILFLLVSFITSSFYLEGKFSNNLHPEIQKQNESAFSNVRKLGSTVTANNITNRVPVSSAGRIPIIVYHGTFDLTGEKKDEFSTSEFSDQMNFLKQGDYSTLSLDELYACLNENKLSPKNPIVITFDESKNNIYKNAFPILVDYGFKAAVFITTDNIDKDPSYLSSENIKQMHTFGIDIGSCAADYNELTQLPYSEELIELKKSKTTLEKLLNKEIKYIAYPKGSYNKDTIKAAKTAGYKMGFAGKEGHLSKKVGMLALKRINVNANEPIETFKKALKAAK